MVWPVCSTVGTFDVLEDAINLTPIITSKESSWTKPRQPPAVNDHSYACWVK
jgi:hypothetical protein